MAKKISELIRRLETGYANQEKELERVVRFYGKDILDLNRQQLFKGEDSQGKGLRPYKSKWYAAFKRMLNPLGVTDLYLTGRFYSNMFIERFKFPVKINSRDAKTPELVDDYGKDIFGLNEESKTILAKKFFKVELNKYWRKVLRLR
jgi:hypothetical protein